MNCLYEHMRIRRKNDSLVLSFIGRDQTALRQKDF